MELSQATGDTRSHSIPDEPLSTTNPALTTPPPQSTTEAIYDQLTTYPFFADEEFLHGLAAILGHPEIPVTPEELRSDGDLVLRARCFYLSRKLGLTEPIDPAEYVEWRRSQLQPSSGGDPDDSIRLAQSELPTSDNIPPSREAVSSSADSHPQQSQPQEPPYPTSFAAIVDLITRNLPVPGIEEVPPTVLEPGTSKVDNTPRRKKPWEKDGVQDVAGEEAEPPVATSTIAQEVGTGQDTGHRQEHPEGESNGKVDVNGHITSGEGVVKILQPNAIADSGLLSKD